LDNIRKHGTTVEKEMRQYMFQEGRRFSIL